MLRTADVLPERKTVHPHEVVASRSRKAATHDSGLGGRGWEGGIPDPHVIPPPQRSLGNSVYTH